MSGDVFVGHCWIWLSRSRNMKKDMAMTLSDCAGMMYVHRSPCWFFISSSRTLWPSRQSIHLCLCPTSFFILSGSGSVKFARCNYLLRGQSYARLCDVLSLTSSPAAESLVLAQHNLEFNVDVMLVSGHRNP